MKRIMMFLALLTVIGMASTAEAAPTSTLTATAPTQYVDGNMIPVTDTLTYNVYCSAAQGGPYNFAYIQVDLPNGADIDVGSCVQGVPGTYYFVATAFSTVFAAESAYSNEASRTYSAADLGKVPLAPTLLQVQ